MIMINNNDNNNNDGDDDEILGWHLVGDSHVSWVRRTCEPWLATFLGEGKL